MIDTGPENYPVRTADDMPVAFHDLPKDRFPFRLRFLDEDTDEVLQETIVRGMGSVRIPGWGDTGRKVKVEITFANGMQHVEHADGRSEARQITPPPRF